MIWTTLVSALINKIWQLFWTFWHCRNLDKNNICTLSVKIRFNCNHYETALKSTPKTCFSASKVPAYRFYYFQTMYMFCKYVSPFEMTWPNHAKLFFKSYIDKLGNHNFRLTGQFEICRSTMSELTCTI